MTLALPETLKIKDQDEASWHGVALESIEPHEEDIRIDHGKDARWKTWLRQTTASFAFVTRNAVVAAIVLTFLVSEVGRQGLDLLLQYVSKRYGWSLSEVSHCRGHLPNPSFPNKA